MCPSSWKLYLDDFPFLGSSLAHLEPKLELFEVWELMPLAMMMICRTFISQTSNNSTSGSRPIFSLTELGVPPSPQFGRLVQLFPNVKIQDLKVGFILTMLYEINVRQIIIIADGINSQTPKLQRALNWVLDELERNQKEKNPLKYNFQDDGAQVFFRLFW